MLELTELDAFYGNSRALQNINLNVGSGEFLSVLGRNGVGKTTLMRSILGLMDRVTGRLTLDGTDISKLRTYQRAKAGISYVPQGRGILPHFTVRENYAWYVCGKGAERHRRLGDRAVSGTQGIFKPPGWKSFRRAAAAACHRSSLVGAAEGHPSG